MQDEKEQQITQLRGDLQMYSTVVTVLIIVLASSTIFFHVVEKWKWLDSFYFTIVTVATVGYGNYAPVTDLGKVGNIILIIVGIGIFTVFITQFIKRQSLRRLEKQRKLNKK